MMKWLGGGKLQWKVKKNLCPHVLAAVMCQAPCLVFYLKCLYPQSSPPTLRRTGWLAQRYWGRQYLGHVFSFHAVSLRLLEGNLQIANQPEGNQKCPCLRVDGERSKMRNLSRDGRAMGMTQAPAGLWIMLRIMLTWQVIWPGDVTQWEKRKARRRTISRCHYNKDADNLECLRLRTRHCSTRGESSKWIGSMTCQLSSNIVALGEIEPWQTSHLAVCAYGIIL